jgi:hypothetical protein
MPLSRFHKPAGERENDNLIVLFADKGQEIITNVESGFRGLSRGENHSRGS